MKRFIGRVGVPLVLGLSLLARAAGDAASSPDPAPLVQGNGMYPGVRTDGRSAVWLGADSNIFAATIETRQVWQVTTDSRVRDVPDVDGNLVVWSELNQDCAGCGYDIRARNLASGQEFAITEAPGDDRWVSISGTRLAWIHQEGDAQQIMTQDITTGDDPEVVAHLDSISWNSFHRPEIDGGRLIWGAYLAVTTHTNRWELWGAEAGAEPFKIAEGTQTGSYSLAGYDIAGSTVVYAADRAIRLTGFDATGDETVLAESASNPTTDGRYVFWEYFSASTTTDRLDIRGYDLATGSVIGVRVDDGYNAAPEARGGTIIWHSEENGGYNVYGLPVTQVLPSARQPDPGKTDPNWTYYPETGHYLSWGFRDFWRQSGGLPVFGYPLTEEFSERGVTVQYLERQRFEYHPEHAGTPYEVELGRLGFEDAQRRDLLDTAAFQPMPPTTGSGPTCDFFPETGHRICLGFRDYWQSHGLEFGDPGTSYRESLALFGYPLSEQFADPDTGLTVQYFERAVFEYHPDNPEPYRVLLKRLGAETLIEAGWLP